MVVSVVGNLFNGTKGVTPTDLRDKDEQDTQQQYWCRGQKTTSVLLLSLQSNPRRAARFISLMHTTCRSKDSCMGRTREGRSENNVSCNSSK